METKFTRKLNDLEAALSNFNDALTLEPGIVYEMQKNLNSKHFQTGLTGLVLNIDALAKSKSPLP